LHFIFLRGKLSALEVKFKMVKSKKRGLVWLISILTAIVAISVAFNSLVQKRGSGLPVYYKVPEFLLTDHNGKPFGLKDLKGKIWVAKFFFTSCAGICIPMNQNMKQVQKAFANEPDIVIVSITVDPQTDTPEVLREFRKNYDAIDGKWFFLTGNKKDIYRLARHGFKVAAEEVPPQEEGGPTDFIHSDRFILVDRNGFIRGYYNGTDSQQVKKLIADIRRLMKE
jgi:protein SCO1/2